MTKLLIFSTITMLIILISLFVINKKVTEENTKDKILKVFSILTVVIHYSSLWVDYFTTGKAEVENNMLIPIYPCNICMWMLLIVAFMKDKQSALYKMLTEFLSIAGTVCGLVGLFANEIFISNPDFFDYNSLKGLLSHSTMIFGTLFILTQGYIKVRTISFTINTSIGLIIFAIIGAIVNLLFYIFGLDPVNAMFMLEFPFDIPGASFVTLGILGIIIVFIMTSIYEFLFLDSSERWYHKINEHKEV